MSGRGEYGVTGIRGQVLHQHIPPRRHTSEQKKKSRGQVSHHDINTEQARSTPFGTGTVFPAAAA